VVTANVPEVQLRSYQVVDDRIAGNLLMRPGVPKSGMRIEFILEVGHQLKEPDAIYGNVKPLNGAKLLARFSGPGETLLRIPLETDMPGKYGIHVTPASQGKYTLKVKGKKGRDKFEFEYQVYVDTWPAPDYSGPATGKANPGAPVAVPAATGAKKVKEVKKDELLEIEEDDGELAMESSAGASDTALVTSGVLPPLREMMLKTSNYWYEIYQKMEGKKKYIKTALHDISVIKKAVADLEKYPEGQRAGDPEDYQAISTAFKRELNNLEKSVMSGSNPGHKFRQIFKNKCLGCHVKFRWDLQM